MNRYEILILTVPEITKDEASTLEFQIEKFINDAKGSIISFDRWGKYRLSYPVRGNDYGVYFLARFDVENNKDFLKNLKTLFYVKFNDIVMRHVVTALEEGQSLEYKKPPSLEDTPKRSISFLQEGQLKPTSPNPTLPKSEEVSVKEKVDVKVESDAKETDVETLIEESTQGLETTSGKEEIKVSPKQEAEKKIEEPVSTQEAKTALRRAQDERVLEEEVKTEDREV